MVSLFVVVLILKFIQKVRFLTLQLFYYISFQYLHLFHKQKNSTANNTNYYRKIETNKIVQKVLAHNFK